MCTTKQCNLILYLKRNFTHSGYFRLYKTIVGMPVTYVWKIHNNMGTNPVTIFQYVDILVRDMIEYVESYTEDADS